ncbi:MAG: hypothetical protein JW798_14115 [Prolixibacteraceae bacterium]|nr:hypothetical protein [Prolixibacteraceae bacterium]
MNILVISYTQTGQLDEILKCIVTPLNTFDIDYVQIKPNTAFPFPWTSATFFDAMPETVLEIPIELADCTFKHSTYDLIILGYQTWFLSPSLPISSLLQLDKFKEMVKNTPVITIIGARNMWINSQKSINKRIAEAGGKMVGNIPFIDRNNNYASAVTILYWMLTGKKDRMLKIFPVPGVGQNDIDQAPKFGEMIEKHISANSLYNLQHDIVKTNHIEVSTNILFIENRAKRIFMIWAKLINKFKPGTVVRKVFVTLFKYYLLIALFVVAPIVLAIYNLLILPFVYKSVEHEKNNIRYNSL